MVAVANNIINEILEIDQSLFTKDEIIALVNRVSGVKNLPIIESDGIVLNHEKYHVTANGVNHVLPRKEFELLYYLIENKNKVVRREAILTHIWGSDVVVGDRTIDVHIRKIREKTQVNNIRTVKGIGYVWDEK
jgi:two-component system alkaline phosphatase synthesis response regulator PhoP